jgi:hypothetical protein
VKKPISTVLVALLGLGGLAYPQAQVPPDPGAAATPGTTNPSKSDPSTATPGVVSPSPAQSDPGNRGGSTARSEPKPTKMPPTRLAEAATAGTLSAGTSIESPAGEAIGAVKDVVPDPRTGRPNYILVTTRSGANTAIPYSTLAPMFRNGRVILDRSRLEDAPRVSDSQLRNPSDNAWQQKAQQYWNARGGRSQR